MLDDTIQVHVAKGAVERYRELLRTDWSRETLDEVLALLWKLIAEGVKPSTFPWQKVLASSTVKKSMKDFDRRVIGRIHDLSLVFTEPSIPAMPDQFTATRPSRHAAQAEQAWAYLMLQSMTRLNGNTGLFQDVQSLLFLCAANFLLPQLRQQRLTAEHDCLACAMYVHTLLVWRQLPAHLLYLQSVLMDHLGDDDRRLELLDLSFMLTSPQDHAYLTRATAFWSELMEQRKYEEASKFLFSLSKHAPDACQDEIRDMLSETLVEANNGSG